MLTNPVFLAKELMEQIYRVHGVPQVVHADRGTSMTSKTVAALLADLEVTRSHSRQNLGHGSSGCGGKLLFAFGGFGAHPYEKLREAAVSGELADDISARRDLGQMGEGARRQAGDGAREQHRR